MDKFQNFFANVFGFRNNWPGDSSTESDKRNDCPIQKSRRNEIPDEFHGLRGHYNDEFENSMRPFSFQVFADPLEMARAMEQHMEDMMRNFGRYLGNFDEFHPEFHQGTESKQRSLRDQMLGGTDSSPTFDAEGRKIDTDIDRRILKKDDLNELFRSPRSETLESPQQFFSYHSFSKTMRPDGTIEEKTTKRDNTGRHEVIERRKIGDKGYEIIKRRDLHGKDITEENFINIEPSDLPSFDEQWKKWNNGHSPKRPGDLDLRRFDPRNKYQNDDSTASLFDKFFGGR